MSAAVDRVPRELRRINECLIHCRACPRLVAHRERVGQEKRRAYREEAYWARPVPSFGDERARLLIVGLAPAAHGANRTGRMFTGDSSGDWLYRALHRAGFANQPSSRSRGDGLELRGAYVTAAAHCAPPGNKPDPRELGSCRGFLAGEIAALRSRARPGRPLVLLALGAIAHRATLAALRSLGTALPTRVAFAHGATTSIPDGSVILLDSYHPSRQNTQTGRLTEAMLDDVVGKARALLGGVPPSSGRRVAGRRRDHSG